MCCYSSKTALKISHWCLTVPTQLFLVFNGIILQEVYDKILHSAHRPLPPQIEIIRLKWRAGLERVSD